MSRREPSGPLTPRHRDWASSHDRAQALGVERLDAPLGAQDAAWLVDHLGACRGCRDVAAVYARQQAELRRLRDEPVVPPRDLWARTAAAIESDGRQAWRLPRATLGPAAAAAGVMGLVVVTTAAILSLPTTPSPTDTPRSVSAAPSGEGPFATPITVAAGSVGYIAADADGSFSLYFATVDRVCPDAMTTDCEPVDGHSAGSMRLGTQPTSVVMSPTGESVVVVGRDFEPGGGDVLVYPFRTPNPDLTAPPASPAPDPTEPPATEPPVTEPPLAEAPATTEPPATTAPETAEPGSVAPSPPESSSEPPDVDLTPSPEPSPIDALAIASGVAVLDQSAAYSRDGDWFAFSAWPDDGSHGPDVYLWHVGDEAAIPVTTDHRSVFASWLGNRILGSRVAALPAGEGADADLGQRFIAEAFLMDPATLAEQPIESVAGWRPVAAPDGRSIVYWDGTLTADETGVAWRPAEGRLVLIQQSGDGGATPEPSSGESATPAADEAAESAAPATASPDEEPVGGPSFVGELRQVIASGPMGDVDVRWDATGQRVGVWIADRDDPTVGLLSLYQVETAASGTVRPATAVLSDRPARAGFSVSGGRLAWATPAEGDAPSRVEIVAWSTDGVGRVETSPRGVAVVIIR